MANLALHSIRLAWASIAVRLPAILLPSTLLLAAGLYWALPAAAQTTATPAPPPGLTVAIAESGKALFLAALPDLLAPGRMGAPASVKFTSALGALKAFCRGVGGESPDIVVTTRQLRSSQVNECGKNGVDHIAGVALGRSAMVLAVRADSKLTNLTSRHVYLALARDVPDKDEFRRNAAIRWLDLDRSLPELDIRFHVPPRGDSGRPAFDALILQGGCRDEPLVKLISSAEQRIARCITTRVDRVREIAPPLAVRALLEAPAGTVGVISFAELQQSEGKLAALELDGVRPEFNSIVDGTYAYASTYYLYAKRGQVLHGGIAATDAAVDRIVSMTAQEKVTGPQGTLAKLGLTPLPEADRAAQRDVLTVHPDPYLVNSLMNWFGYVAAGLQSLGGLGGDLARGTDGESTSDFSDLMEIAGYKTQEVQTSISIIPSAGMTFGIVRSMSEADQDYLDRRLQLDMQRRPGALPALQRNIVRAVLDVSEAAEFEISRVEIEFVPLPSAKLIISPSEPPISMETAAILRAIERLKDRISELAH